MEDITFQIIEAEVGFDDTAYFSKQFLLAHGITPSDFRSGRPDAHSQG